MSMRTPCPKSPCPSAGCCGSGGCPPHEPAMGLRRNAAALGSELRTCCAARLSRPSTAGRLHTPPHRAATQDESALVGPFSIDEPASRAALELGHLLAYF